MNYHEKTFISTFVIPEKRARYADFLQHPKRRKEILRRLNHFFDFVPELATRVPRTSPQQILSILRNFGAQSNAHVLGGPTDLDGIDLPLVEAIARAFDAPGGIVISCVPSRLALYMQEFPPGDTFVLATTLL